MFEICFAHTQTNAGSLSFKTLKGTTNKGWEHLRMNRTQKCDTRTKANIETLNNCANISAAPAGCHISPMMKQSKSVAKLHLRTLGLCSVSFPFYPQCWDQKSNGSQSSETPILLEKLTTQRHITGWQSTCSLYCCAFYFLEGEEREKTLTRWQCFRTL